MSRGQASDASAAPPRELLQSSVGKPLRIGVTYKSFDAPSYDAQDDAVVGRLWAYDQALDMVVLETGRAGALPASLRRAAASAAYDAPNAGRGAAPATTGFKLVQGRCIARVDILSDEEYAASHGTHGLSTVASVPVAAMEARDAAATKRSLERAQQIGPKEAGELGQGIFDALSKTYVFFFFFFSLIQAPLPLARCADYCARRSGRFAADLRYQLDLRAESRARAH